LTPIVFVLVLASALLHALWSVSIKGSRDPLVFNLLQQVSIVGVAALALPFINLSEIPTEVWRWLALTGVTHSLYFYWMSRAFEYGDITLVYPIARSAPAFLPLIAIPLFGESISTGGAAGIVIVVAGLWLVHASRGLRSSALTGPAARFAYLTLLSTIVYSLADKGAMAELAQAPWSSPIPRALAYCILLSLASSVLFSILALRRVGVARVVAATRTQLGPATAASINSLIGYGLILKAMETAPASYVVAVRQISVLFVMLLGAVTLRERPGPVRVLGGASTVAGVVLIALYGNPT